MYSQVEYTTSLPALKCHYFPTAELQNTWLIVISHLAESRKLSWPMWHSYTLRCVKSLLMASDFPRIYHLTNKAKKSKFPQNILLRYSTTLHPFNGIFSRTTCVSQYQKGKNSLDLNDARDDRVWGWQWHQMDDMHTICTSLQTDNNINTSILNF